jgi:hypothetical protein
MMTMTEQVEVTEEEMEQQLPKPVGYRLLIALPTIEKEFDSGIAKAERTLNEERIMTTVGVVLDMGAEAYSDTSRFPHGAWCKIGDYVVIRPDPRWHCIIPFYPIFSSTMFVGGSLLFNNVGVVIDYDQQTIGFCDSI